MKPIGNKIIVKRNNQKNTTESGIFLQRSEETFTFTVLHIGPEVLDVSVGDELLLQLWGAADKMKVIDKDILLIPEDYVVSIIER